MKLSEGIRLGSAGREQIRDAWYTADKKKVCAIGALMLVSRDVTRVYESFPQLAIHILEIKDRNDRGETFNQIIEWLESIGQ